MNFRKVVLALATAGLGLTGIASAQITCTTATATTGTSFVRVEGTTELVPSLTIGGCTQGAAPTSATISVTTSAGITNANVSGQSNTDASASFFGGTAVKGTLSGNTLTFTATGASLGTPGPGTPGTTDAIVISGVRVNAASVPVNTSITETAVAGANVILTSPAATATPIAYTQQGMAKPVFQGLANKAICAAGTAVVPLGQVAVSSGFNGAFVPEGTGSDLYISVNFGNLAGGANYYVPVSISAVGTDVLNATKAELVPSNTTTTVETGSTIGPSSGGPTVTGVAQLTATNGSASALYHLTGASAAGIEAFIVPLYAVVTSGSTAGVTSSPTVTATFVGNGSASYDQFSSTQNPASVSASGSATFATLPFPASPGGLTVTTGGGQLTTCATTLLFPYILNAGGYDTGIALTNASAGTSLSQDGTCSVMFYGTGVPSTNPYVTGPITAGTVGAFTVSSQASGFIGYAIATCNFQDAHGFAFITDGFGAPGRGLSQGYLAIVTSAGGTAVTTSPF